MPMPNLPIKTGHVFIGLAVVMGLATVGLFNTGKPAATNKVEAKVETQDVVVPMGPINEGTTLTRNDVTVVKWPAAFIPQGNVFSDPELLVGRVARQDLFPGEPIFKQKVTGSDTHGGLTAIIPPGMRAVTIAVTEIKGVAGFVKPGDRVDILTTFELDKNGEGSASRKTRTVLQDVLVLASAQTMVDDSKYSIDTPTGVSKGTATGTGGAGKDKDDKDSDLPAASSDDQKALEKDKAKADAEKTARLVSSITLALTPEQTETLALAEESGTIRLSLRADEDHSIAKLSGANTDEIMGDAPAMPKFTASVPKAAPPPLPMPMPSFGAQVEFIQGNDKTLYNFGQ
jgi:Flp pilus assembly protein CpaB